MNAIASISVRWGLFLLAVGWAAPYTVFGMVVGILGVCTGGRMQWKGRALEFYGGAVTPFLDYCCGRWVSAITFGHTILGRDARLLDACREHEWVHVRQYQRWGPFMGPAYLLCSAVQWCRGKHAYLDNPFEREAYAKCDPRSQIH